MGRRYAAGRLRQQCDVPGHGAYKKFGDQYDICDFKNLHFTKEDWSVYWERHPWGDSPSFFHWAWPPHGPKSPRPSHLEVVLALAADRIPKKMAGSYADMSRYGRRTYKQWIK